MPVRNRVPNEEQYDFKIRPSMLCLIFRFAVIYSTNTNQIDNNRFFTVGIQTILGIVLLVVAFNSINKRSARRQSLRLLSVHNYVYRAERFQFNVNQL